MPNTRFGNILEQLAQVLGPNHVHSASADTAAYRRATYASNAEVLAVVRPGNTAEVAAVARLCQQAAMPFYAFSTGRNWGYGSATPPRSGLAVDLGRMDRIRAFDDRLGHVRVEPGVTYARLHAFLQERGGAFWIDAAGSHPGCSVVGNALERGFGHTPYADHAAQACALEVVLPRGDVIETGLGAFGPAKARDVYAPGLGPALDGLFFQSGFGIVTAMTVWLMPAPERFRAFFFGLDRTVDLPRAVEALRPLRLHGLLRSAVHIGNAYRVLPSFTQFPWGRVAEREPLRGAPLDALQQQYGVLAWHGSGALYGTAAEVREGTRRVRRALAGVASRLIFVDDARLALARRMQPALARLGARRLARQIDVMSPAYGLLKGVPTDRFLSTVYWRKRAPAPPDPDPDRDGCGLIWCSVLSAFDGEQAGEVNRIATDRLLEAGYEPAVTTTLLSARCLEHVISISYDREVAGEDEAARSAFESLLEALVAAGYVPYRLPTLAQGFMQRASPAYRALLARLEQAVDPARLYAQGRYTVGGADDVPVAS